MNYGEYKNIKDLIVDFKSYNVDSFSKDKKQELYNEKLSELIEFTNKKSQYEKINKKLKSMECTDCADTELSKLLVDIKKLYFNLYVKEVKNQCKGKLKCMEKSRKNYALPCGINPIFCHINDVKNEVELSLNEIPSIPDLTYHKV